MKQIPCLPRDLLSEMNVSPSSRIELFPSEKGFYQPKKLCEKFPDEPDEYPYAWLLYEAKIGICFRHVPKMGFRFSILKVMEVTGELLAN
jgi:hypothetical protein